MGFTDALMGFRFEEIHPSAAPLVAISGESLARSYSDIAWLQEVACPTCGAGLGRWCLENGWNAARIHRDRAFLAMAAYQERTGASR